MGERVICVTEDLKCSHNRVASVCHKVSLLVEGSQRRLGLRRVVEHSQQENVKWHLWLRDLAFDNAEEQEEQTWRVGMALR